MTITWNYAAGAADGRRLQGGLREGGGGKVVEELYLPFPDVEFQAL